jgi:hypothetical protein
MSTAPLPDRDQPSPQLALRINALCDRFEAAWQSGQRPCLDDFLQEVEEAVRPALRRELLDLERYYRQREHS